MPRPVTLTPELLNTFVELVRLQGDAGAAAKELGINQPSMSKRLAHFQHPGRLIHRPWLVRRGKTWLMTDEGARVLPAVQELLRRYDLLLDFVSTPAAPSELSFACGREAFTRYVEQALVRYQAGPDSGQRPVQISVETRGQSRITGVLTGQFGMALVTHSPTQIEDLAGQDKLYIEPFDNDSLVLACSSKAECAGDFVKLRDRRMSTRTLGRLSWVLPDPDSGIRRQFEERLKDAGLIEPLRVVAEGGGWDVILAGVKAGKGVGLLPRRKAMKSARLLLVRVPQTALLPPNVTYLIARKHPGRPEPMLSSEDERFLSLLREEVQRTKA